MGGDPLTTAELLSQLTDTYGEEAVRRALSLTPVLSLTRDAADFHLDNAVRARAYDGPSGSLVLEVPRKQNEPVEITFLGEARLTLEVEVQAKPRRRAAG